MKQLWTLFDKCNNGKETLNCLLLLVLLRYGSLLSRKKTKQVLLGQTLYFFLLTLWIGLAADASECSGELHSPGYCPENSLINCFKESEPTGEKKPNNWPLSKESEEMIYN